MNYPYLLEKYNTNLTDLDELIEIVMNTNLIVPAEELRITAPIVLYIVIIEIQKKISDDLMELYNG